MEFGLVLVWLISPFEAARVRVTSNVVEKAEGVENVIPLTRPGNISAAYPGNTALWHDESLDSDRPFHQHRRRGNHRTTRRFDIDA